MHVYPLRVISIVFSNSPNRKATFSTKNNLIEWNGVCRELRNAHKDYINTFEVKNSLNYDC